jgi:PiT family inorganic phosphate transporter
MPHISLGLLVVILLILAAEFVNGWTDAPNAITTVVSTRVMSPRQALVMAVVMNIAGTMVGLEVAKTIGTGIVRPEAVDLLTVGAAMVGIVIWSTVAWYYGLPTSESHALIAGLSGAALATGGPSLLLWSGWQKVLLGLAFSTFLGFGGGLVLMTAIYWIFGFIFPCTPRFVRAFFGKAQVLSAMFMAFGHGTNDGQKFIGAFTLALMLGGILPEFAVPFWVILLCAGTMGIGTATGGWRIVRTMGLRMTKLEPVQGFAAETGAALTMQAAAVLGIPLSTTHTICTSIMGVGATRRFSAVRWGVSRDVVSAWILTFPICGVIAFTVTKIANYLF